MTENHMQRVFARDLPHSRTFLGSNGASEREEGVPVTIPGNRSTGPARAKSPIAAARSRFALSILFCFFPKPGHCRIFFRPVRSENAV
jgi:hypothetical protein